MTAPFPITPDFENWPLDCPAVAADARDGSLHLTWGDGRESSYHAALLAENDPAPDRLHPKSRETLLSPLDLPGDLALQMARIDPDGVIVVIWNNGRGESRFHPGWLRGIACFADETAAAPEKQPQTLWNAANLASPPSFDGVQALTSPPAFVDWLRALRTFGVARLQGLPDRDGLLEEVVQRIGPVRESNFGRIYSLEIKEEPDSNAFTAEALLLHMDMPTRECPHGLQFLFCRENTTSGGEGLYVDGYRIAEDMRREEPTHFQALCDIRWTYNNRSRTSSYQATGPVIELDQRGQVSGIRYNTWLRAPLIAPLAKQARGYAAYRAFAARAQDPAYQLKFAYRPGDLLAFDNRRVLHGRSGYDADHGRRFIEGIYADRDDLRSFLNLATRQHSQEPQ